MPPLSPTTHQQKLDALYQQFQQYQKNLVKPASPAQLELLLKLFGTDSNPDSDTTTPDSHPWSHYSMILKCPVSETTQLTHAHCVRLCQYHQQHRHLTRHQRMTLLTYVIGLGWEKISHQLRRPVHRLEQLRLVDYNKLIRKNPQFNLREALDNFQHRPRDRIVTSNLEWEYGWQESPVGHHGHLAYLKFNRWVMLDFDDTSWEQLQQHLQPTVSANPDLLFYIYRSRNGYHAFVMSETRDHLSVATMTWMFQLGCDVWYILFSYRNGFRVRLSPKIYETAGDPLYQFQGSVGTGRVDPECQGYHTVYLNYLDQAEKNLTRSRAPDEAPVK